MYPALRTPIVADIAQLDKSSLSFASVFGLSRDAHLHGTEYSWLSSIVYFAQLVFQPLSVYALVRVRPYIPGTIAGTRA